MGFQNMINSHDMQLVNCGWLMFSSEEDSGSLVEGFDLVDGKLVT